MDNNPGDSTNNNNTHDGRTPKFSLGLLNDSEESSEEEESSGTDIGAREWNT